MKAKLLIVAFLVVFAATVPVLAEGNGNGGGNAGQTDDGDNGNGNGNDDQTNTSDRDGNSGNGNNGGGNGANNKPSTPDVLTVVPEQDLLSIVKAGQAVSLASLLPNVQERTGGEIIDAQLVRAESSLIYVVKVLTPDGRVGIEYYNARSGTHIEAR